MSVDKQLLEILVCPVSKVPVKPLPSDRLNDLNDRVRTGGVHYVGGGAVEDPLDEGLITEDGRTVYRVNAGIPVMLEEQGIATSQLEGW